LKIWNTSTTPVETGLRPVSTKIDITPVETGLRPVSTKAKRKLAT